MIGNSTGHICETGAKLGLEKAPPSIEFVLGKLCVTRWCNIAAETNVNQCSFKQPRKFMAATKMCGCGRQAWKVATKEGIFSTCPLTLRC